MSIVTDDAYKNSRPFTLR